MKRRDLLKGTAAAGAALALPGAARAQATVPAMPLTLDPKSRRVFEIAKAGLDRTPPGKLWLTDIVGVADYGVHSSQPRFHFANFETGQVQSYLVSHGSGSDPEHDGWLNWYSNVPESQCSSKGAYMTFGWYTGRYGTSIRLEGMDPTNSNALDRAIVMHRAGYAEPSHLAKWGRLGRSNGCFAMGEEQFKLALLHLAGGRLLLADNYGIGPNGEQVRRQGEMELLVPEGARGQDRLNPGVY